MNGWIAVLVFSWACVACGSDDDGSGPANGTGGSAGASTGGTAAGGTSSGGAGATSSGGTSAGGTGGSSSGFSANAGYTVTGSPTDGSSITIVKDGGGFGTKPNGAKPASFIPYFEGATQSVAAYARQTNGSTVGTVSANAAQKAPGSAQACETTHTTFLGGSGAFHTLMTPTEKLYTFVKARKTLDRVEPLATNNWKALRINPASGGQNRLFTGTGNQSGLLVESAGGGTLNSWNEFEDDGFWTMPDTVDDWSSYEAILLNSEFDTADGDLELRKNDIAYRKLGVHSFMNRETAAMAGALHASTHMFEVDVGFGTDRQVWTDYSVADDSWCRVLLVDPALDGSPLGVEYQVATAWDDAAITFTLRQGSFPSFSGTEIHVYDNQNQKYVVATIP